MIEAMATLWRRLNYLLQRAKIDRELQEEMAAHRAAMADPASFGSTLKLREEANDAWGFGWWDRLWQDLHFAWRILWRSPGFTITAVAVLAFGVGLNVTAFGFLNTAMFRPMPGLDDPHTLMRLTRRSPEASSSNASYPSFDFYQRNNKVFTSMLAVSGNELTYQENTRWKAEFVTPNYFSTLGTGPAYGRLEFREPGDIVLSATLFATAFASDPAIIGKPILLNRKAARVIGVTAADFQGLNPQGGQAWASMEDHPHFFSTSQLLTSTTIDPVQIYGRLAPGLSPQAAQEAMLPLVDEYRKQSPLEVWKNEFLHVEAGAYIVQGELKRLAGPLLISATLLLLVLLTACANLGNLLLARSLSRERELSIRRSVGATRWRIVRQLMTESIALALLGAAAGLFLSSIATKLLVQALDWPPFVSVAPDWRVTLFAFCTGLLASLLFGLAPALEATRQHATRAANLRLVLVGLQAAACCVLLILSGLLGRGLQKAVSISPGFSFEASAVIDPNLAGMGLKDQSARIYFDQLKTRISQLPGVEATAIATLPPLGQRSSTIQLSVGRALLNSVDPDYFATMQIPLLNGRNFRPGDRDVTILGERTAARLWPNQNPIGKEFTVAGGSQRRTVVGIAANAAIYSPGDPDAMEVYFPIAEANMPYATLLLRTAKLAPLQKALQQAANEVDPAILPELTPMREGMERRLRNSRSGAWAVAALGAVSLSLAILGFAGLISFAVSQRSKEIGIRLALGATRWQVMSLGFDRLIFPTAIGLSIGMAIAAALAHLLRSEFYGLSSIDPITFLAAPALFLLLAFVCSLGPLSRAARIEPSTALRYE